jgi:hypothetical protein
MVDEQVSDARVAEAFAALQAAGDLNRRAALATVAERFGISTRTAYAIIEKHKSSAK